MIRSSAMETQAMERPHDAAFTTGYGVVVPAIDTRTMRELEDRWLAVRGDDGSAYLRLAAERLATVLAGMATAAASRLAVVVGGGWNGRVGMAAAHLASLGAYQATVVAIGPHWTTASGRAALRTLRRTGTVRVMPAGRLEATLAESDLVVDALVGTGLRGRVRPALAAAIRSTNRCARRIVSLDVPSGLDADTGVPWGPVVRPSVTLTLGLPKRGLADARASMSPLLLADMRLPTDALAALGLGRLDPFGGAPVVALHCRVPGLGRCDQQAHAAA